jgi:hypothetical protein
MFDGHGVGRLTGITARQAFQGRRKKHNWSVQLCSMERRSSSWTSRLRARFRCAFWTDSFWRNLAQFADFFTPGVAADCDLFSCQAQVLTPFSGAPLPWSSSVISEMGSTLWFRSFDVYFRYRNGDVVCHSRFDLSSVDHSNFVSLWPNGSRRSASMAQS